MAKETNRERMTRYWSIPYSQWKCYAVPVNDTLGWGRGYHYVEAPNKTLARHFTIGEVNPWVIVKGKIREVEEKDYPRLRVFGPERFKDKPLESPATR